MAKEILCGFGIDVDAVAGWLGSYGGEDSPDDISRGLFAGEVGSPRLLVWVAHENQAGYDEVAARAIDYAAMQTILTDWFSSGGAVSVISSQAARQSLGATGLATP